MRKYNAAKTAVPGCRFKKPGVRGRPKVRQDVTVSAEQGRRYHVGMRKPVTLHPRARRLCLAISRVPHGRHGVGQHAATSPRLLYHTLMSHDVDFGGSLQHSSLVGATFAINLGYVPRDACCSYFTRGILVGKGSELYNNISPENWCQYPFNA